MLQHKLPVLYHREQQVLGINKVFCLLLRKPWDIGNYFLYSHGCQKVGDDACLAAHSCRIKHQMVSKPVVDVSCVRRHLGGLSVTHSDDKSCNKVRRRIDLARILENLLPNL